MFYIFGQVRRLMFVVVNFSVMFTDFGHIHSVILHRSSEWTHISWAPAFLFSWWSSVSVRYSFSLFVFLYLTVTNSSSILQSFSFFSFLFRVSFLAFLNRFLVIVAVSRCICLLFCVGVFLNYSEDLFTRQLRYFNFKGVFDHKIFMTSNGICIGLTVGILYLSKGTSGFTSNIIMVS